MFYYAFNGTRWEKFYSYLQLINWLSKFNKDWLYKDWNTFLESTSPTGEDLGSYIDWHNERLFVKRDHRICQEDFISIYCEKLKQEVRDWRYVESIEHERQVRLSTDKDWEAMRTRLYGPARRKRYRWEYSGGRHKCGHYAPGTHLGELRRAADLDHTRYIRPARNINNLPSAWDDRWTKNSSGWKRSTKYRHQWEPKADRLYKKALKASL